MIRKYWMIGKNRRLFSIFDSYCMLHQDTHHRRHFQFGAVLSHLLTVLSGFLATLNHLELFWAVFGNLVLVWSPFISFIPKPLVVGAAEAVAAAVAVFTIIINRNLWFFTRGDSTFIGRNFANLSASQTRLNDTTSSFLLTCCQIVLI